MQAVAFVRQAFRGNPSQIRKLGDYTPDIGVNLREVVWSPLQIMPQLSAEKRNSGKRQVLAKIPNDLFQIIGIMEIFLFGIGLPLMPEHSGKLSPFQCSSCTPDRIVIRMFLIVPWRTSAPFPCGNRSPANRNRNKTDRASRIGFQQKPSKCASRTNSRKCAVLRHRLNRRHPLQFSIHLHKTGNLLPVSGFHFPASGHIGLSGKKYKDPVFFRFHLSIPLCFLKSVFCFLSFIIAGPNEKMNARIIQNIMIL